MNLICALEHNLIKHTLAPAAIVITGAAHYPLCAYYRLHIRSCINSSGCLPVETADRETYSYRHRLKVNSTGTGLSRRASSTPDKEVVIKLALGSFAAPSWNVCSQMAHKPSRLTVQPMQPMQCKHGMQNKH